MPDTTDADADDSTDEQIDDSLQANRFGLDDDLLDAVDSDADELDELIDAVDRGPDIDDLLDAVDGDADADAVDQLAEEVADHWGTPEGDWWP